MVMLKKLQKIEGEISSISLTSPGKQVIPHSKCSYREGR